MRRTTFAAVRHGDPFGENSFRLEVWVIRVLWPWQVSLFLALVRLSSMTMPTAHVTADLELAAKFRPANVWMIPHTVRIWHLAIFIFSCRFEGTVVRTSFNLRWKRHICYHHVFDAKGTCILCVENGQISQTVTSAWNIKGRCRKIAYQWHLHFVFLGFLY
jgi:hypothetical protein